MSNEYVLFLMITGVFLAFCFALFAMHKYYK